MLPSPLPSKISPSPMSGSSVECTITRRKSQRRTKMADVVGRDSRCIRIEQDDRFQALHCYVFSVFLQVPESVGIWVSCWVLTSKTLAGMRSPNVKHDTHFSKSGYHVLGILIHHADIGH